MQPAREVGGDFYDFFLIGDECDAKSGKLGFVVADVSGKGVPAALFMMAAKTAIRGYMESGMELDEAFENANRKLCAGNDSAMFVTAFAGVLDYATGTIAYVNAGTTRRFCGSTANGASSRTSPACRWGFSTGCPTRRSSARAPSATSCCSTPTASPRRWTSTTRFTASTA